MHHAGLEIIRQETALSADTVTVAPGEPSAFGVEGTTAPFAVHSARSET